jgi:ABC-type branched-subunit amino acid transport system substrate-binding protein
MGRTTIKRLTILAAALFVASLLGRGSAQVPTQEQLTPQEKRGKQIYLRCTSPSGKEIRAYLGDDATEVPASTLTCANCHGADGLGRPEGGAVPSNVTWEALTKAYGVTHPGGRKHPPYTERALELAIARGLDPGGNRLPVTMPRYDMSREDMADLLAYMKRLGKDQDPGLTQTSVRVGTFIPADGPLAEAGEAVKAVLAAYFEEINERGGIYNRKVELHVARLSASRAATKAGLERFIKDEQIFAMAGAFMAGADKEVAALMESEEVPLVGPLTLMAREEFPLNRQVFYLLSGLTDQSRVLVDFAARRPGLLEHRAAIVSPDNEMSNSITGVIQEQCKKMGWSDAARIKYAAGKMDSAQLAAELSRNAVKIIFFLGTGAEGAALLKEADRAGWHPSVFLPGALSSRELLDAPASFNDKIFLSFPTLPPDQAQPALMELSAMAEKRKLPAKHIAAQIAAYSAAKILVEGLKLAGRDLSREKLISALEGFYQMETGLTPRISFGPNRRIGALGAYVVTLDLQKKEFTPASEWITPN